MGKRFCQLTTTTQYSASWSSGRVQDSGLGSRSSPGFNTLPVRLLVVPLSKALHAALLLSTQEEMGTCEGRFVSRGAKLRVSGCLLPRELRWLSIRIWTVKGPMTREGTCQSLQSRALSLDVDSKQWLYLYSQTLQILIREHITHNHAWWYQNRLTEWMCFSITAEFWCVYLQMLRNCLSESVLFSRC